MLKPPAVFKLLEKHYATILKQGIDNYPQEVGGFLGGNDEGTIMAIQPLYNQYLFNKTDTFQFTSEDVLRAHEFFKRHNLIYYGLYHTHPKGVAYPSKPDIDTGHKYHFILSLRDQNRPEFNAFYIEGKQPIYIPIQVISNKGFSSKEKNSKSPEKPNLQKGMTPDEERDQLNRMINNMRQFKSNDYPKMPPKNGEQSDFSTLA